MLSTALYVILAVLILGLLIFIHESGHFLVARWCGMRVDKFSIGFGPALWKFKRGDTTYQIGVVPLGGYVQIAGLTPPEEGASPLDPTDPRLYQNRPAWQRFLAVLAGPAINYLFAVVVFLGLFAAHGLPGVEVQQVTPGSPAAQVGLQQGDLLIRLNDSLLRRPEQLIQTVGESGGKPVVLLVQRQHETHSFTVTPTQQSGSWRIGTMIGQTSRSVPLYVAARESLLWPAYVTWMNIKGFKELAGKKSLAEKAQNMSGPVGMIQIIKNKIQSGFWGSLEIMAVFSVLLGCMNLFPLPALDGGRLVFLGWEVITRRPVNQNVEQVVHFVGIVLLLLLLVAITIKDIWFLFH